MNADRKPRILLIDDDRFVRRLAEASLRQIGRMDVVSVSSGLEGIRMLEQSVPDLVLLDAVMPVMNGAETLSFIRHSKKFSRVPVAYLTAIGEERNRNGDPAGGVIETIYKPFSPLSLTERVSRILDSLVPDLDRGRNPSLMEMPLRALSA